MSNRFWGHVLKCLRMPPGHKWSQKKHYPAPTLYPALPQDMVPVARKEEWVVSASPLFTYFMWISDLQQCTRLHQTYSQCFRTQKGRWKQLCSVAAAQRVEWCQHGDRQEDIWAWGQKTPQLVTQISSLPRLMTCFWNFIQDVDKLANQWPFCGVFWSFRTLFLTRFCLKGQKHVLLQRQHKAEASLHNESTLPRRECNYRSYPPGICILCFTSLQCIGLRA